jgi:adenosylcobinamide kinase/adenosylcobinamide-phosphate guanylyltransferase
MAARIAAHRRERPAHWRVREEPVQLGRALREAAAELTASSAAPSDPTRARLLLVDCLTLWISNCLWPPGELSESGNRATWHRERGEFLDALAACSSDVIVVTNEVGTGIVPNNAAARAFRDEQGWLNQDVAALCEEVFFVTAGLPMCLKPSLLPPGRTTIQPR